VSSGSAVLAAEGDGVPPLVDALGRVLHILERKLQGRKHRHALHLESQCENTKREKKKERKRAVVFFFPLFFFSFSFLQVEGF